MLLKSRAIRQHLNHLEPPKTMEEVISSILKGCQLTRDLESNLPHLSNQPNILSKSCDEIISIFSNTRDRFNSMVSREAEETQQLEMAVVGQELFRQGYTQAMNLLQAQEALAEKKAVDDVHGLMQRSTIDPSGRDVEGSARLGGSGGEAQPMDLSDSSRGSSSQRPRRRKDDRERRIFRVAAPTMGNTELPPEDGFTWRKYGQKEILGSRFPRAYYRCTHQKLYQCAAKRQVQRLDDDPYMFEVTYRGDHRCTLSSTVPSAPPTSTEVTQEMRQHFPAIQQPPPPISPPPSSVPLSQWLSMDIKPSTLEGSNPFIDMQMDRNFGALTSGSGGAGPSTAFRYGREVDYQPVADWADAMFNPGSSSNIFSDMELIFSTMEEKKEAGDKKN